MKTIDNFEVYQLAMRIGDEVWETCTGWDDFLRRTIGSQLVRAADSIAANVSEGYGRYHFKDRRIYCYYSRGSSFETRTWLLKARKRGGISEERLNNLLLLISEFQLKLNGYIDSLNRQIRKK
ncbi:MAG: four helix bundle protein [Chitinophagales bacterium]|nr:four helix bundle protein [Chitinophagales bacterium]